MEPNRKPLHKEEQLRASQGESKAEKDKPARAKLRGERYEHTAQAESAHPNTT
jgi:hypothetical protein